MGGARFMFSYLWRRERAERGIVAGRVDVRYALM
jgi:hypothetical protein